MGQPQPAQQPKERRIKNFSEVSLGYPKAISLTESRRCPQCAQPTCMDGGCPLGIDIPGFIRLLREGDAVGALNRIKEQNILPGVCGRVCLAPCEKACVFQDQDSSIGIRALERFAADNGRARNAPRSLPVKNGKKIAIVGSGPSGLAAAAELAKKGYSVTVFEALPKAGGALRYGIPEFRLPSRVLDGEISDIATLGVDIQTNVIVGKSITFEELINNYEAVFLAIGAGSPRLSPIGGDHLIGVYYVQELLMRINLWGAQNYPKTSLPALLGNTVAVIGCGHAAVDCARIAVRMGKKASVIFPGLEEELIVYPSERKDAVEEGVKFESLVQPIEILSTEENRVKGLKCERLDFIENAEGRCEVKRVPGSEFVVAADTVIFAEPPKPNDEIKRFLPSLKWTDEGTIWIDPETGKTTLDKVFAAGNVVTGAGPLVDAITDGKHAAIAVDHFLSDKTSTEGVNVS